MPSYVVSAMVWQVLDEIRPYLVGTGGGGLENAGLDGPIVKVTSDSTCNFVWPAFDSDFACKRPCICMLAPMFCSANIRFTLF